MLEIIMSHIPEFLILIISISLLLLVVGNFVRPGTLEDFLKTTNLLQVLSWLLDLVTLLLSYRMQNSKKPPSNPENSKQLKSETLDQDSNR